MDSIVRSIIKQFEERSIKGKEKYGTDLDRTDLSLLEWLQHAKEEAMDLALYLEKMIQTLKEKNIDWETRNKKASNKLKDRKINLNTTR